MMRLTAACLTSFAIFLIAGCASNNRADGSKEPQNQESALIKAAQTAEKRATQAFQSGDPAAAADGFDAAVRVYDSLALVDAAARARLNLARSLGDLGQTEAALTQTRAALAAPGLDAATRITAHGRLAALLMASNAADAAAQLAQAEQLCAATCAQGLALAVLRARVELAQGNAAQAVQTASRALGLANSSAQLAEQANALRVRAQAQQALGAHAQVIADAGAALPIDQQLGMPSRVLLDLQLLAQAHRTLGQMAEAERYELLARRAQAAQR
jgi:tetratricopeptide (TPR) repeat protein